MPETTTLTLVCQDLSIDFLKILTELSLDISEGQLLSDQNHKQQAWRYRLAPGNTAELTARLTQRFSREPIDFCLQTPNQPNLPYGLACFDMDSTLIQCEVIDELAAQAGVKPQVAAITEQAMNGHIDFNQSFQQRLGLLQGLEDSVVQTVIEQLPYSPGLPTLLPTLRQNGIHTAILSGGFVPFAQHIQQQFGADFILANTLSSHNGILTGQVSGDIVNAQTKANTLQSLAQQQNISLQQTIAVGDGANDLPMIHQAGLGVAYHAKAIVKEEAPHSISYGGLETLLYYLGIPQSQWVSE